MLLRSMHAPIATMLVVVVAAASIVVTGSAVPAAAQDAPVESPIDETSPLLIPFRAEIDFCFERERSLFPGAHGSVTVRGTVDATGHATDAELEASTFDGTESVVAACLVGAVRRWAFPTSADVVGVDYHMTFVLRPSAPMRIAGTPAEIDVRWLLQYRDGGGVRYGDTVAE